MPGLLDYQVDPIAMGLLGAGGALMTPRAQGGGIGAAMQAFPQQMMQGQEMQRRMQEQALRQKALTDRAEMDRKRFGMEEKEFGLKQDELGLKRSQAQTAQEQAERVAAARAAFQQAYQQSGGKWSPQLSVMAMDANIKGEDIERLARGEFLGQQPLTWQGGVGRHPMTGAPVAAAPDVNKPFFPSLVNGQVQASPNSAVQNYEVGKARAGATNIGMPRVEVKIGDGIGGQVGPILKDSTTATQGAVKMADSAERILNAVDSGGVIAGPTASFRLRAAQIASMLGIGGKDSVAQTRQVIRGLAEASVEARKELAGQGQVTENEAKAVQKALSGDIDDLTVDEIRDIAKLNLRHAAMRARQHKTYLDSMPESTQAARPFYQVPGMDRVLGMDPARYEFRPPPKANVAPDGKSASGKIGKAGEPSIEDLIKKYGGQ